MTESESSPNSRGRKNTQDKRIVSFLKSHDASRYMIAIDLSIPIQSVCRRIDLLMTNHQVAVMKKDYCQVSGRLVEFLTSDAEKFTSNAQMKLW